MKLEEVMGQGKHYDGNIAKIKSEHSQIEYECVVINIMEINYWFWSDEKLLCGPSNPRHYPQQNTNQFEGVTNLVNLKKN